MTAASNETNPTPVVDFLDLGTQFSQMNMDRNILSIDYMVPYLGDATKSLLLVGTNNSIYTIAFQAGSNGSVNWAGCSCTELVKGTFYENVTSLSIPYTISDVSGGLILFNSNQGIIEKADLTPTIQTKYVLDALHTGYHGSSIDAKYIDAYNGHAIAGFYDQDYGQGLIQYSSDNGNTWHQSVPNLLNIPIKAVSIDPHPNYWSAYAAGYGATTNDWDKYMFVSNSTDYGQNWTPLSIGASAHINDIFVDPYRVNTFFLGGSAINGRTVKVRCKMISPWINLENGLGSVTQVCKLSGNYDAASGKEVLYAATDDGIYKADITDLQNVTWVKKTSLVSGNPGFISVSQDPNDYLTIFAITAQNKIYVSADSGKSWILYMGQIGRDNGVPTAISFYKNQSGVGLAAGTSIGTYYLPNIVKKGDFYASVVRHKCLDI